MSLFSRDKRSEKQTDSSATDVQGADRTQDTTPDPDDPRKADRPSKLEGRTWKFILPKAFAEFGKDQCTDLAAGLTYYAVLSLAPAAIALLSVVGLVGTDPQTTVGKIREVAEQVISNQKLLDTAEGFLLEIAGGGGASVAVLVGLLTALWSASNYINAFSRAMNRIYEIDEGRPFWKLRPVMLLITLIAVLLMAVLLIMLVVSGGLATAIGSVVGLSSSAAMIWNIAKWPVMVLIVMVIIAILYYATPNVKQPKFRWLSLGAFFAIVVWALAGAGFYLYTQSFGGAGSYAKTYGSLAGVIMFLLFVWISNIALLLGAEIDAEVERGRQLQAGIRAEEEIQLPARDTRQIEKAEKKRAKQVEKAERIRRNPRRSKK